MDVDPAPRKRGALAVEVIGTESEWIPGREFIKHFLIS